MLALKGVDLAGVLGFTGELVGVDTLKTCFGGLSLRLAPAVNAESRYL